MISHRKFGAVLRGAATPFQVMSASLLGSLWGFLPGIQQAPGYAAFLLLVTMILNGNLAVIAIVAALTLALQFILTPVAFHFGTLILDSSLGNLFQPLINAPVLAYFGFEYYLVTGGVLLGFIWGGIIGKLLIGFLKKFRLKMSSFEENSNLFKKYLSRKPVQWLLFIFVGGGKGKKSYQDILSKRIGNPIRPLGIVFMMLAIMIGVLLRFMASEPIVKAVLQEQLETANGATVDIGTLDLDLKSGKMVIGQFAMTDPNHLNSNLFMADEIHVDFNTSDLLRKRIHVDRVRVDNGSQGSPRAVPGRRVGKRSESAEEPEPSNDTEGKSIEEYLENARQWKERLAQVRKWLEKVSGPDEVDKKSDEKDSENRKERLDRLIREKGYAAIKAPHLVEGAPTVLISNLEALKIQSAVFENETLDIEAKNLSTHPWLVEEPPSISVRSSAESLVFLIQSGGMNSSDSTNRISLSFKGLETDALVQKLISKKNPPFKNGTVDFSGSGTWSLKGRGILDLPLQVTLHDTVIPLSDQRWAEVDTLIVPFGIKGDFDNPRLYFSAEGGGEALLEAGKAQLRSKAVTEADKLIQKGKERLEGVLDPSTSNDLENQAKSLLDKFLSRDKKKKD